MAAPLTTPSETTGRGLSSIKFVLLAVFGCLMLLILAVLGWRGAAAWTAYTTVIDQKEFDAGANKFITGLYEVLLERLATNNALQAADPASPAVITAIEAHRKVIKDNFDVGLAVLEQRGFPQRRALLDKLAGALQKANDYRRQADEAIKRPRDQRDENLRRTFTPVLTDSVNAALNVWFSALYRTAKADPKLARLASIKEIGWRMRDYPGQERANVSTAIASGTAIPPDRLAANATLRSRVDLLWQQLQNLTQDADTHPAIKNAMQAAEQKYYKDFLGLSDEMRKVGEAGQKYPMTPPQWVQTTNPQIGSLLDVLYAARTAGEAAADTAISQALGEMTVVFGLIALTIAIAVGCAWVVIVRVSTPLTRLSGAMLKLANGNFDVVLPGLGRKDEIGSIAGAVETFKVNAAEKVEREAAETARANQVAAEREAAMHAEDDAGVRGGGRRDRQGRNSRRFQPARRSPGQERPRPQHRHRDQLAVREHRQGARRSRQDAQCAGRGQSDRAGHRQLSGQLRPSQGQRQYDGGPHQRHHRGYQAGRARGDQRLE